MNSLVSSAALKCPNCASTLSEDTWNREEGVACCAYCRSILPLPPHIRNFRRRPRLPMPVGLTINEQADGLIIERRWFPFGNSFWDLLCLMGSIAGLWWFADAMLDGSFGQARLIPVLALATTGYVVIVGLLNRSWIRVTNGVISVSHGPLPWTGKFILPCCEVDQLFAVEQFATTDHGPRARYVVCLVTTDGTTRELLTGVNLNRDQVLYVEQQLERALGIDDRTVPGEIHRV